jgi:hypothetical protein
MVLPESFILDYNRQISKKTNVSVNLGNICKSKYILVNFEKPLMDLN